MFAQDSKIGLPLDALADGDQLAGRPVGHRPTVFLDYDGTLTPIVDRAEDALISVSGSVARHYRLIGKSERARIVGGRAPSSGSPSRDEVERFRRGLAQEET